MIYCLSGEIKFTMSTQIYFLIFLSMHYPNFSAGTLEEEAEEEAQQGTTHPPVDRYLRREGVNCRDRK